MVRLLEKLFKGFKFGCIVLIILFVIIGIVCVLNAFGNTWTIDNGKFKEIYDDIDDCINTNLGTGTTEKCYDSNQVIYRNR